MRLAALSIDLDEISQYCAIHGLGPAPKDARWAMYRYALPRFEAFLERRGIRATAFAIGDDLSEPIAAIAISRLHQAGHEIANHSQDHRYDLTRLSSDEVERQIAACSNAIEAVIGCRPEGFRAPGYTINDAVVSSLVAQGFLYDSSVFPCPSYYAAKAAAMTSMWLGRRTSHSIMDDPRVLTAPANPYRMGKNFRCRGAGLLELPIGVTRGTTARLPFIGTSLTLAGPRGARMLARAMVGRPLVNLELHGIDFADAESDGLAFLAHRQPDLRVPLDRKLESLEAAIDTLLAHDYRFVTLAQAARDFSQQPSVLSQ